MANESPPGDRASSSGSAPAQSLLPAISAPKGGGAIRGIGEKLSTNLVTGTSTLSIPVALSSGRGNFAPQLELRYDSGAGNGPFGLGIRLSAPSIARKTDKGVPRYFDDTEGGDVFVLSGAEDLVPARVASTADAPLDAFDRDDYHVVRYRPRLEGAFARIERWTNRNTGDAHWRVTTPDNIQSIYGRSPEARIVDPVDSSRVFSWLLEETRDDRGNVCCYRYKAEDGGGVSRGLVSERSRFRDDGTFATSAQRYLKRILYGNRVPVAVDSPAPGPGDDWLFEAVFDYGDHDAVAPTTAEQLAWPVRPDPFSTYRCGFELRSYRLCQRVLMFHRFAELGDSPCLVKSTDFAYADSHVRSAVNPAYDGGTVVTHLASVTHAGYVRNGAGYARETLPPLTLRFSQPIIDDSVTTIARSRLGGLPDTSSTQWVDLDGEGVPGLLTSTPRAWYYQPGTGDGHLADPVLQRALPSPAEFGSGGMQLVDLAGDGNLDLVRFAPPLAGFFERTDERDWRGFTPLTQLPNLDWNDPNLRFVDLDGDGLPDLLITEHETFRWYRSLGEDGFEPARRTAKPSDEDLGPAVVFADGTESIHLADISGDGLVDLVRIRNGEVCYWPNLGHGRFGHKVTLDGVAPFDHPERFDPRRIRIGDLDGSGTSDLIYLTRDGARLYFNRAGNSLSPPLTIASLPPLDLLGSVTVVDLLGHGTACLVWSTPAPAHADQPVAYVDLLAAGKPHLLSSFENNLGGETRLSYAPSTRFYLEDKAAGRPWLTRLSFPVHVVEHVERIDHITGSSLVSRFGYHHGYYDGYERELRGFALVEQWDAESFEGGEHGNALVVPPLHTKTWFHTGAWLERERLDLRLTEEYYAGDASAPALPPIELPRELTTREEREAARALRGQILRQETYAEDNTARSPHPYVVTVTTARVRLLQRAANASHAVFHVVPQEGLTLHYERKPEDPRITHELALEVDDFGNVVHSCSVAYPRRAPEHAEQARMWTTSSQRRVINRTDQPDWYRIGVAVEDVTSEITGLSPPAATLLTAATLRAAIAGAAEIPFERQASGASIEGRVIAHARQIYYRNDLTGPLPLGTVESRALPFQNLKLAFTPGLITSAYGDRIDATVLANAGYIEQDASWWSPSPRTIFDATRFLVPVEEIDPFNKSHHVEYDSYALLPVATVDARGNRTSAEHDYRVLAPKLVTDANGNRAATAFDALGFAVAIATMGKLGASEGDTLADPTVRMEYDLHRWQTSNGTQPSVIRTLTREQHGAANPRWQSTSSYSDGFGRHVMTKMQAAPGPVPAAGVPFADPRWIGSGRTVYDNKGNPIRQYEPFFAATADYESESAIVEWGVTPTLHYDPIGRLVRTEMPDGSTTKVVFSAWRDETWDANDDVAGSAWRARMETGTPAEQRAVALAMAHADTPNVAHLDPLGRAFRRIADNAAGDARVTRLVLDIQGNALHTFDPRGIDVGSQAVDLFGRMLFKASPDSGESRTLSDATNQPVFAWNARGFRHRWIYDELRRPTHLFVRPPHASAEVLVARTAYGESLPPADAIARNARGRVVRSFDSAGVTSNDAYDFKGNVLTSSRQLAKTYRDAVDWSALGALGDVSALDAAAASQLAADTFTTGVHYDALNRIVSKTTPDGSIALHSYNPTNLIERIEVRVRGAAVAVPYVTGIEYNARGSRERIVFGNGTTTAYRYDPATLRVAEILTTRDASGFVLQQLSYTYDAVGNIAQISDGVSFGNDTVSADGLYEYDALYQLTKSTGREHPGQQPSAADSQLARLEHPEDLQGLRRYREEYSYDASGNITQMAHVPLDGTSGWTRLYSYAVTSNRLIANSLPGDGPGVFSATYAHDVRGNITAMPHLATLEWDHGERLQHDVYFAYDASGQRVAKYYEHGGFVDERVYVGEFELQRKRNLATGDVVLARETLHVADAGALVALVETKTVDTSLPAFFPATRSRYQVKNHLGSAAMELDEAGAVITYEEYFTYGGTSFRAADSATDVSAKRYRYCGLERDEETGFNVHGRRYYAPWLARWTSSDPIDLAGGTNVYGYCGNNPVCRTDLGGTDWGWLNPTNWCNPLDDDCEVAPVEITKGFVKAGVGVVRDTGARVVDMTTMANSAFGKATGWYDVGYTEWSPEAKKYDPEKSTWQNISGNVYDNTAGGMVNLGKGIYHGDMQSIGAGLFVVVVAKSGGGGGNPTISMNVPALAFADTGFGTTVAVVVSKTVTVGIPATEALTTANVGSAMMMSSTGGGGGGKGSGSGKGSGGTKGKGSKSSSKAGKVAKAIGGTKPIPRGTNLALGLSETLDAFASAQDADSVFTAWDKGFLNIPFLATRAVFEANFPAIVDTFIENGGRLKFDLTGLTAEKSGVTTWELGEILSNKKWASATDFFKDGTQLKGAALEKALKPWR